MAAPVSTFHVIYFVFVFVFAAVRGGIAAKQKINPFEKKKEELSDGRYKNWVGPYNTNNTIQSKQDKPCWRLYHYDNQYRDDLIHSRSTAKELGRKKKGQQIRGATENRVREALCIALLIVY